MTLPANYSPAANGCTYSGCASQETLTLCGRFGRRCDEHAPWRTLADEGADGAAYRAWKQFTAGRGAA